MAKESAVGNAVIAWGRTLLILHAEDIRDETYANTICNHYVHSIPIQCLVYLIMFKADGIQQRIEHAIYLLNGLQGNELLPFNMLQIHIWHRIRRDSVLIDWIIRRNSQEYLLYAYRFVCNTLLLRLARDTAEIELPIKEAIAQAVRLKARWVVLCHNHPSGSALPSRQDIEATAELARGLYVVGIELLDHIIVTETEYLSLRQRSELPEAGNERLRIFQLREE